MPGVCVSYFIKKTKIYLNNYPSQECTIDFGYERYLYIEEKFRIMTDEQ